MERAAKISGSRFGFIVGDAALVALAMYRLGLDRLVSAGFTPVFPPVLVREEAMYGTGFFPSDKSDYYAVPEDGSTSRRHVGGPADRDAHGRDSRGAADPLLRVLVVLPPRVGRRGPRHARDVPRAPVPEGRDGRLHASRGVVGRARAAPRRSRSRSSRRSSCRTASSTPRPATSRPPPPSGTTSRRGSRRRSATARSPRARTRPTTRRGGAASATAPASRLETPHTLNGTAVADRMVLAILENFQGDVPDALLQGTALPSTFRGRRITHAGECACGGARAK